VEGAVGVRRGGVGGRGRLRAALPPGISGGDEVDLGGGRVGEVVGDGEFGSDGDGGGAGAGGGAAMTGARGGAVRRCSWCTAAAVAGAGGAPSTRGYQMSMSGMTGCDTWRVANSMAASNSLNFLCTFT
jgi:hypothetical protein